MVVNWVYLVSIHHNWVSIFWQLVVRLSELLLSMSIGPVLVETTFTFLDPELAELSLVIIVLNIHHFKD